MGPGQLCLLLFVLWQQELKSLFELAAGPSSGASCTITSVCFRITLHSFGKGLWTKREGVLLSKGDGGAG